MKAKPKKQTKAKIKEAKDRLIKSHNNDIDDYIAMAHTHYKAHIANPYKENEGYNLTFSGFIVNASITKSKNFIDLINLLNSLKK